MNCDCGDMERAEMMTVQANVVYADGSMVTQAHTMSAHVTLDELFQAFKAIALGLTYQPGSWENVVLEAAEEIEQGRQRADLSDYINPRRSMR